MGNDRFSPVFHRRLARRNAGVYHQEYNLLIRCSQGILGTYTEWQDFKGFMCRNHPHRQEGTNELEDTALAVKENKNCI